MPRKRKQQLAIEQSLVDLEQALAERKQLVGDREQSRIDQEQIVQDELHASSRGSAPRHGQKRALVDNQARIDREQTSRDVNQEALDHGQHGRDVQQAALDDRRAMLDLPTAEHPELEDANTLRREAIDHAHAARERAEAALIRAQAAFVRAQAAQLRAEQIDGPSTET